MSTYINHGFWDVPEPLDNETPKKNWYPPHKGRSNTPAQRRENIEWAEEMGGVRFDKDYNPTYVVFKNAIYNAYNNDIYKPTYFQNRWEIQLYKMTRGLYKDNKEDVMTKFEWNHLQRTYKPKSNFPKPT